MSALVVTAVAAIGSLAVARQARDTPVQASAGTATITGVVTDDGPTPKPLRRALVAVTGSDLPVGRSAITDDHGRFTITLVPATRVMITATKAGYVPGAFGAVRPGRPGTPAVLRTGETRQTTIRLTRAAVLTGTIRDERGEPVQDLRVFALNALNPIAPAPTRDPTLRTAETDDRGVYRIHDLAPGDYIIAAVMSQTLTGNVTRRSAADTDALLAWLKQRGQAPAPAGSAAARPEPVDSAPQVVPAPSYYPGTAQLPSAGRITLGAGEVRGGLDFVATSVPVTTIEGTVVADGGLPASVSLSITPVETLQFFALGGGAPQLTRPPFADGRFRDSSVLPGKYVITARGNAAPGSTGRGTGPGAFADNTPTSMYAVEQVEVTGQPSAGVTLHLRPGSRFAGRLVFEESATPVLPGSAVRVALVPREGGPNGSVDGTLIGNTFTRPGPVTVSENGTFEIVGVPPGGYTLSITTQTAAGQRWWFRSAASAGGDLLDTGLSVQPGVDVIGVVLTATDRHSEISGTLQSPAGVPAPEYFVITMPADRAQWVAGSRRVKSTRPGTDGRFSFTDLPAGDYLLVALTDVEPGEWQKPSFLSAIAPAGVRITLAHGERKQQDLRISGGSTSRRRPG